MTGARSAAAQRVFAGQSFPLGATVVEGGVNFCTSSRHASAIELLLFAGACDAEPSLVIRLDAPSRDRGWRPGRDSSESY